MSARRSVFSAVILLLVAVGVWGFAAAQDNNQSPFLGIVVNEVDKGAQVEQVQSDSPAAKAGVKIGDVITQLEGQAVTARNLREELSKHAVGDIVALSVLRGDQTIELKVTLTARPEVPQQAPQPQLNPQIAPFDQNRPMLGIRVEDSDTGVVIREVVTDSPAAKAGLQGGDIVKKVDDHDVKTARAVVEAVVTHEVGDAITLEVERDGKTQTVSATLEASPALQIPNVPFGNGFGLTYNANDKIWALQNLSEDSPLYQAGLRQGDIITKFDGKAYDPAELQAYIQGLKDVKEVIITVQRDGKDQEIKVPIEALNRFNIFGFSGPDGQMFNMPFDFGPTMNGARLGVEFVTLDETVAKDHNLKETEGALVTQVLPDSPAAKAGLKENDVIVAVNGEKLDAERTLRDRLSGYEPGDTIKLDIARDGQTMELDATLDQVSLNQMLAPFFNGDGNGFQFQFPPQPEPAPSTPNI
jgi:S1-C subfamily serine protease